MFRVRSHRLGSFHAILDELADADALEGAVSCAGGARFANDWPSCLSVRLTLGASRPGEDCRPRRGRAFRFFAESATSAGEDGSPAEPASEEERIAAELGLRGGLPRSEIRRIWRAFAKRNHPDRLPPEFRDRATRRMIIANMLVDRALRAAG